MKIHFQRSAKKAKAFTLVEVVISTCILAIAAAGLMGCLNFGFFMMKMARENLRATQIMLERTEAIRLWRWDKMSSTYIPSEFTEYYDPADNKGTVYTGNVTIEDFQDQTVSYWQEMKQITVTLTWKTGDVTRNRSVVTYVSRYGIQNYVY